MRRLTHISGSALPRTLKHKKVYLPQPNQQRQSNARRSSSPCTRLRPTHQQHVHNCKKRMAISAFTQRTQRRRFDKLQPPTPRTKHENTEGQTKTQSTDLQIGHVSDLHFCALPRVVRLQRHVIHHNAVIACCCWSACHHCGCLLSLLTETIVWFGFRCLSASLLLVRCCCRQSSIVDEWLGFACCCEWMKVHNLQEKEEKEEDKSINNGYLAAPRSNLRRCTT